MTSPRPCVPLSKICFADSSNVDSITSKESRIRLDFESFGWDPEGEAGRVVGLPVRGGSVGGNLLDDDGDFEASSPVGE